MAPVPCFRTTDLPPRKLRDDAVLDRRNRLSIANREGDSATLTPEPLPACRCFVIAGPIKRTTADMDFHAATLGFLKLLLSIA